MINKNMENSCHRFCVEVIQKITPRYGDVVNVHSFNLRRQQNQIKNFNLNNFSLV